MQAQQYIDDMQKIQCNILAFLEDETNDEENFVNLQTTLSDQRITENRNKFKSLLYLISNIGNYHYRNHNFCKRLEKILILFKEDIQITFTNSEIFNIFDSNMRLLLFLLEENMLVFNEYMVKKISEKQEYLFYFAHEVGKFPREIWSQKIFVVLPYINEELKELRRIGENENEICKLIRDDMVKEFITYVNRNNITLDSIIKKSDNETNPFLVNKKVTIIEYTAFFGSIQIFNYLLRHNVQLLSSIWLYAIHGRNAEIINELEANNIMPPENSYLSCFIESIKCHHNEHAYYFLYNFLKDGDEQFALNEVLKYYNFAFMQSEFINESTFYHLIKNDYCTLVNYLLKTKDFDINEKHNNKSLLYHAVEKVHIEIINLLIKCDKLDINAYNTIIVTDRYNNEIRSEEKTALYLAIEDENTEIVKLLLTNDKLDINIFNKIYYTSENLSILKTALYLAVEEKNIGIIKLLLANEKTNINLLNKMNDYMETAFYLAVDIGDIAVIELFLSNEKIDINVPSEEIYYDQNNIQKKLKKIVNTPLHLAVEKMDIEIVKLLLKQKNINFQIKNYDGKTPFESIKNEKIKQLFPH